MHQSLLVTPMIWTVDLLILLTSLGCVVILYKYFFSLIFILAISIFLSSSTQILFSDLFTILLISVDF